MAALIIEAGRTESQYWRDLWRYRELFYVLAWRDITVRYKQTAIGVLWALVVPFINSVLLTLVFNRMANLPSIGNAPYFLVVFAAQMPWQFFSNALGGSSQSILGNAGLISKIYFPRLIVPAGAVVTALADLLISFLLLFGFMLWYRYEPTWHLLLLPCFVALAFGTALGPGLLFTALTVKYRDFRYIIPFVLQIGTFISPVGFSTAAFTHSKLALQYPILKTVYALNPMVGVIDGFRWSILGNQAPLNPQNLIMSTATAIVFMFVGIWFFRRIERSFADVI